MYLMAEKLQVSCSLFKSYCVAWSAIDQDEQCNPDIRELPGPETTSLISRFGPFCLGNAGSNVGPDKKYLLYPGYTINYHHCKHH